MARASGPEDFRPQAVGVRLALDRAGDLLVEARPATIGLELAFREVKRRPALTREVEALGGVVPVLSRKRLSPPT